MNKNMQHARQKIVETGQAEPHWLRERRQQALASYQQIPLQKVRYGLGVSAAPEGLDLEVVNLAEKTAVRCADPRVKVLTFQEALQSQENLVRDCFIRFLTTKSAKQKMKQFHAAFCHTGALIIIPDESILDEPIVIEENLTQDKSETIIIHVGKNSRVIIVETAESSDEKQHVKTQLVSLHLDESSHVYYGQLHAYGTKTYSFAYNQAVLGRNARLQRLTAIKGGAAAQQQSHLLLQSEGAEGKIINLLEGKDAQLFDGYGEHVHAAPRTTSNLIVRSVLDDKAKGIFRGLIKINEGATGCNGYQKEDALLLSEEAEADMVPNLEINNNDVRCTHGATVGKLDPEQLFYLTSRGISSDEAKQLLIKGFFEKAISEINNEQLQQHCREWLKKTGSQRKTEEEKTRP